MKYIYAILMLLLVGCSSKFNAHFKGQKHRRTYMFRWMAERYAEKMEEKGCKTEIYKNNWFNLGGYPWVVEAKEKKIWIKKK